MTSDRPPASYSINQLDYDPDVGARLRIFVDGVEQRNVTAYDCGAGTVVKFTLGSDGQPVIDPLSHTIVSETATGTVTVEWREPAF